MAIPLAVLPASIRDPRDRPVQVRARFTGPVAVSSDSYLGGFASGLQFRYLDEKHFVWWAPGEMPLPSDGGYGSGGYGDGPYGEPASGAYGAHNYGRGTYGGS